MQALKRSVLCVDGVKFACDSMTNIPPSIMQKTQLKLYQRPHHPLGILSNHIKNHFGPQFKTFTNLSPVVSLQSNFDSLLVPEDHVSRRPNDTYYINKDLVLRTHTSAHQVEKMQEADEFLVVADVYRRDEIDSSHYPVFHQIEGVKMFDQMRTERPRTRDSDFFTGDIQEEHHGLVEQVEHVSYDLKYSLESLIRTLFPKDTRIRWIPTYFPFTSPSWEMEIYYQDKWLEVLGCGIIQDKVLQQSGKKRIGWAFGIGLERLAMVLFDIPDIRLFWSEDQRFLSQFRADKAIEQMKFKPFSKYPSTYKDVSLWLQEDIELNDFCEIVRNVCGDLVEDVKLIDEFTHPKNGLRSQCYRLTYRSMTRTLISEEVDELQQKLNDELVRMFRIKIR